MADISWYGEAVFSDVPGRDRARGLIEDYMQATQNTTPYGGQQNYAAGIEQITQFHLDEFDGPGLRWCFRMPDTMGTDAAAILEQIDGLALTYNAGTAGIA